MSSSEVTLSVFDPEIGPISVFSTLPSPELARKIAIRTLMLKGGMEEEESEIPEAVLPFPEAKRVVYVYLFNVSTEFPTNPNSLASLSLSLDRRDQMSLFQTIPALRRHAQHIAASLSENYKYTRSFPLPSEYERLVSEFGSSIAMQEGMEAMEEELQRTKVTLSKLEGGSFHNALEMAGKNLDKLLRALFIEQPVVVAGEDETEIGRMISSLELFVPHRVLRKMPYSRLPQDLADIDILGADRSLKFSDTVVLDIKRRKVQGGKSSGLLRDLLKEIKNKSEENAESIVHRVVNDLIDRAGDLVELCSVQEVDMDKLEEFKKNLGAEKLEIVGEIAAQKSPIISSLIRTHVGARFVSWMQEM